MKPTSYFPVGVIRKPHGLNGELKVSFYRDWFSSLFLSSQSIQIDDKPYTISTIRPQPPLSLIKIAEVNSIDEAKLLQGKEFSMLASVLEEHLSKENHLMPEFWIDFEVYDQSKTLLGCVDEIIYTGSNDVISVHSEKEDFLVPVTDEYLLHVDNKQKRLIIKYPEMV